MDTSNRKRIFSQTMKWMLCIGFYTLLASCGGGGGGGSADTIAPVISLNGANEVTLFVGEAYNEEGATATDDRDGVVNVSTSGSVDTDTIGVYTITYTASDAAGNSASATRTVNAVERDTTPETFTFTDEVDVELNVSKESNTITVTGIDSPADISVAGGEYSIDGGTFTSDAATITNDQTVSVRHTSSALNDTVADSTLTIGGVSDTYSTTTTAFAGQLAILPSGSDLVLMGMDAAGALEERDRALLSDEFSDYSTNHVIFSVTKHPTQNMVFVTSMNECGAIPRETDGCWGNGRIDRFTYDSNSITYDGLAFLAQGPLRLSTPVFDDVSSELSLSLTNQSQDDMTITTLVVSNLTVGSSFTTTCDGAVLSMGDQCAAVITAGAGVDATGDIAITTPIADFSTRVNFSTGLDAYVADGLDNSVFSLAGLPDCALDDFGESNQLGGCAMTAMAISGDASRAYVNEDANDTTLVFSLDASGNMTLLSQDTAGVSMQGIAVNSDNTAMYNGSSAYSIENDIVTLVTDGDGGNATEVTTDMAGQNLLISTISNSTLSIFELDTDPLAPTLIDTIDPSLSKARFQDHSADLSVFAVIDLEDIASVSFDGTTLTEMSTMSIALDVGVCEGCSFNAYTRAVQVTDDGLFAVTSSFVNANDELTVDTLLMHGAATTYSIDPTTGAMAEVDQLTLDGMARSILIVETP